MSINRQLWTRMVIADVVLFVIASVFNDHSSTSFDGIVWWLAVGLFGLLLVGGSVIMIVFLQSRVRRRRRLRSSR